MSGGVRLWRCCARSKPAVVTGSSGGWLPLVTSVAFGSTQEALDLRGGRLSLGVKGMAWWSGDGRCVGWLPWAGMTTATPFGAVPLLGDVVLALTPHNTKNPLRAMVALVDSCNVPEALQVFITLIWLLWGRVGAALLGATKLGNDDTLQSLYRIVDASCV
uniref:Uncharacterized protein n=1 Tax=Oryza glumipatula TaxID=40148 RepID=A0A0D9Z456_9ORYZ